MSFFPMAQDVEERLIELRDVKREGVDWQHRFLALLIASVARDLRKLPHPHRRQDG
jgi:hypothetical protein